MAKRVALQMDPIASIKPQTDSTLLLGLEAQRRGYELFYYTPDKLSWNNGAVTAEAQRISLHEDSAHYYDLGERLTLDLKTMDVILLRQDPPFDMAYLGTTWMLEQVQTPSPALPRFAGEGEARSPLPQSGRGSMVKKRHPDVVFSTIEGRGPLVVNNPVSVRNCPEKWFPIQFRQFMPPTLVSADAAAIERFWQAHKDIVIKPLYGFGGHGVYRITPQDQNFHALMEMAFSKSKEPWVAQPFLPEVKTGERRIILIDGEIAAVVGRIPAEGEIRANLRVGGTPVAAELTPRQRDICAALKPVLKEKGLILAGVDVIGDYLIEINITSPTTLAAANRLYGKRLEAQVWDAIESKIPA